MSDSERLGTRLRELRMEQGTSLREVAHRATVNHGYLSQLERGEIAQPSPAILAKVAAGYGVSYPLVMSWAGYAESGLSPQQETALRYLGEDVTVEELEVIRAVLDALRSRATSAGRAVLRAGFAGEGGGADA